jgi:hypothetical protein
VVGEEDGRRGGPPGFYVQRWKTSLLGIGLPVALELLRRRARVTMGMACLSAEQHSEQFIMITGNLSFSSTTREWSFGCRGRNSRARKLHPV